MVRNAITAAIKADNPRYEEAVKTLNTLQTNAQTLEQIRQERDKRAHLNIPRMLQFVQRVGIKEEDLDKLNVIHVSGTKGKGSTCAYCESVLRHHGYKTGFFSSPHLVEVRERFALNGTAIEQEKFASYFWDVYNKLDKSKADYEGLMPNYFSFLTVMALQVFLQEGVDVAIMEVGIGGQYDSTNLVKNPLVCGVSSLGLDHTSILGTTVDKIAWHKAGIFKRGVPAYTVPQAPEAMRVLRERAEEIGCPLYVCPEMASYDGASGVKLGIKGSVQAVNASLALQLCNTWIRRYTDKQTLGEAHTAYSLGTNGKISPHNICDIPSAQSFPLTLPHQKGLEQCQWLGRNQTIKELGITFYIDGAHTVESMQQCVEWFTSEAEAEKSQSKNGVYRVLIFNMTGDRETTSLLKPLLRCDFDAVLFCPNIAYEQATSADQTNNTVTKESQIHRCIENKDTWERLCKESKSSTNGIPVVSNGFSNYYQASLEQNGTSGVIPEVQNGAPPGQKCSESHALPSISHCINWVSKQQWVREKKDVVNGDVEDIVSGVVDHVVNSELHSKNGQVNAVGGNHIHKQDQGDMLNSFANGSVGNGTVGWDIGDHGSAGGMPHVQVLITGSLHLVGGALKVLWDRQN